MPRPITTLTLKDAKATIAAAEEKATAIERAVNIAVVDAGGHLVAHVRMDGARFGTVGLAIDKAHTARAFEMTTEALGTFARPGAEAYGIQHAGGGRVVIFAGGLPVERGGDVIGTVGVSGSVGEEDRVIAEAGLPTVQEG